MESTDQSAAGQDKYRLLHSFTEDEFPLVPRHTHLDSHEALVDYTVDGILGHQKDLKFHVLSEGYPRVHATWEPAEHFMEEGHVTNEVLSQYMYDRDMIIP